MTSRTRSTRTARSPVHRSAGAQPFRRLKPGETRRLYRKRVDHDRRTLECVIIYTGRLFGEVWSRRTKLDGTFTHWLGGRHASALAIEARWQLTPDALVTEETR